MGAKPRVTRISRPAPAKLNLFLRITGQRSDGYHELQTAFQFLDFGDTLHFSLRQDERIQLQPAIDNVAAEDNLVVRAAHLLQREAGVALGADIDLEKNIPMGAGLGGGSSDAATTLVALNQLWECSLSKADLAHMGLSLGADVPIFVHGRAAWAEGVGECFSPVNPAEPWYLLIHPACSVSTQEVFSHSGLTRNSKPLKIPRSLRVTDSDQATEEATFFGRAGNDCEAVVRAAYPEVDQALRWLSAYGAPRLTGTGSAVFLALPSEARARELIAQLPSDWAGFVTRGLNRSPLYGGEHFNK